MPACTEASHSAAPAITGDIKSVSSQVQNFSGSFPPSMVTKPEVNHALSKALKAAVKSIAPSVTTAIKSCGAVEAVIEELEVCWSSHEIKLLLEEWRNIVKDFKASLASSRMAAVAGAGQAREIFTHILPYLLDEDVPLGEKQAEIGTFKKSVDDGRRAAKELSRTLEQVISRIASFRERWKEHAKSVNRDLSEKIDQLEIEINDLTRNMNLAAKLLARSKRSHNAGQTFAEVKLVRKENKKCQQADKYVSRQTENIVDNTNGLVVVWNLISDDVTVIKNHLDLLSTGDSVDLFKARLEKLPGQYKQLELALSRYASALAHRLEPGDGSATGRWESLQTYFSRR